MQLEVPTLLVERRPWARHGHWGRRHHQLDGNTAVLKRTPRRFLKVSGADAARPYAFTANLSLSLLLLLLLLSEEAAKPPGPLQLLPPLLPLPLDRAWRAHTHQSPQKSAASGKSEANATPNSGQENGGGATGARVGVLSLYQLSGGKGSTTPSESGVAARMSWHEPNIWDALSLGSSWGIHPASSPDKKSHSWYILFSILKFQKNHPKNLLGGSPAGAAWTPSS
mmetsp:Transcript_21707/g.36674  ORF Transcript_21707/g.36674 Transcript_21707/m.36674 type:complete len:225 (-) Transcript_21707:417-1091(-)